MNHYQAQFFKGIKYYSHHLKRDVVLDVSVPFSSQTSKETYPVLFMNDGQDFDQLRMNEILESFYAQGKPFVFVGIHCNKNRLHEYGTSGIKDYKGRGSLATKHNDFVVKELLPMVQKQYPITLGRENTFFCGFSLGGLSAIDIVWENQKLFSKVGVFSGSFWWRKKAFSSKYSDDQDRIMHQKIRNGIAKYELNFWFECGTNDEKSDRNNNGIIDSIDDTLDLISELKIKGYNRPDHIKYVEIEKGEHNFNTWRKVMPEFLVWIL